MITVVTVTKAKSIHCSTLNSILHINMYCLKNNIQCNVQYITEMNQLRRFLKNHDRVIFFDYGSCINNDCVETMCSPMPKGFQVMVFPAVKEGVDWEMFKRKTIEGSREPAEQRGLRFDTKVDKQFGDYLWTVESTEPVVWMMDVKPVNKITTVQTDPGMFKALKHDGVKICACTAARCTQSYIHTCVANILETSGINLSR
jgi:hypothetical protein